MSAAGGLLEKVRASGLSGTVRKRLEDLGALIAMLEDREWALEGEDRDRILSVFSYFADPLDLIPDSIPGLGYLDDEAFALAAVERAGVAVVPLSAFAEQDPPRHLVRLCFG